MNSIKSIGAVVACLHAGFNVEQLQTLKYASEAMENPNLFRNPETGDYSPEYGIMQKTACLAAAKAYEHAGKMKELPFHIFTKLASAPSWDPYLDKFSDAVFVALAKNAKFVEGTDLNDFVKKGAQLGKLIGTVGRAGMSLSPEVLKVFLAAGAGTGAAAGSLWWLANRHAREDDTDVEALREQTRYYNQLTDDISEELRSRGVMQQPAA